jgi:ParB family chromosome partitioning protein
MMMFAIHHARTDWDPLPTAFKLRDLEDIYQKQQGRRPTESELAELASTARGEVRRLKKILALPAEYHVELMEELEKPRHLQVLTVDLVLETTRGVESLIKRGVIAPNQEDLLRKAIVSKYREGIVKNSTDPRMLARIGRSVERGDISLPVAKSVAQRLIQDRDYSIKDAFKDSAERAEFEHGTSQIVERLIGRLEQHSEDIYVLSPEFSQSLGRLKRLIEQLLKS